MSDKEIESLSSPQAPVLTADLLKEWLKLNNELSDILTLYIYITCLFFTTKLNTVIVPYISFYKCFILICV